MEYDGEAIRFEQVDETDDRMAGSLKNMSSYDVTLTAIKSCYQIDEKTPVSLDQIEKWRRDRDQEIAKGMLRNHLTVLQKRGKIERPEDGHAIPANESKD